MTSKSVNPLRDMTSKSVNPLRDLDDGAEAPWSWGEFTEGAEEEIRAARETELERYAVLELQHHRTCGAFVRSLCDADFWNATLLPNICSSSTFWISVLVWASVTALLKSEWADALPEPDNSVGNIHAAAGSFIAFLLVFYCNQCFQRWHTQYFACMACNGTINTIATLLRGYLGPDSPHTAQIVRYANCAYTLGIVGLSANYTNAFFHSCAFKHGLLTKEEAVAIRELNPARSRRASDEVVMWAVQTLNDCRRGGGLTDLQAQSIEQEIVSLRSNLSTLYHYDFQPVPFPYYSLCIGLLRIFLPINAFMMAWCHKDWVLISLVGVLLVNAGYVGIQIISDQLSHPFGDQTSDFTVLHFIESACNNSRATICSGHHFSPAGEAAEFLGEMAVGAQRDSVRSLHRAQSIKLSVR